MANAAQLMSSGMPGALAQMLDTGPIVTVTPAGASQGTAAAIPSAGAILGTAAAAGVILPNAMGNSLVAIYNNSGNAQNIYPASGETINALTSNTAVSLASGKAGLFFAGDKGWLYVLSA